MIELTDDERKVLTEYIGDNFEELSKIGFDRNFNTVKDLHAVYSAIEGKGKWEWGTFSNKFAHPLYLKAGGRWMSVSGKFDDSAFTAWLFCLNAPDQIPERMKMVVEWINQHDQR